MDGAYRVPASKELMRKRSLKRTAHPKRVQPLRRKPSTSARSKEGFNGRLALTVADRITDEIRAAGWPIGQRLGTEAELMRRYKVSREPLRQGVRLLEFQGLLRVERGARGGLVIQAPASQAVSEILRTYLQLNDIAAEQILAAILVMQRFIGARAVRNITQEQILQLRAAIENAAAAAQQQVYGTNYYNEISEIVSRSSMHPVAMIFSNALRHAANTFSSQRLWTKQELRTVHQQNFDLYSSMVDALIKRDLETYMKVREDMVLLTQNEFERVQQRHRKNVSLRSFLAGEYQQAIDTAQEEQKSAVTLAYSVAAKIRRENMMVGTPVGSQKELLEGTKISRAVLREAACLLEFFGVVEVRVGTQGGVFVSAPDPQHTIAAVVTYLNYEHIAPEESEEFRRHVMQPLTNQIAQRMTVSDVMRLRATVAAYKTPVSMEDLLAQSNAVNRCILSLADNPALRLFAEIMLALPRFSGDLTNADAHRIFVAREKYVSNLSEAYLRSDRLGIEQNLQALQELGPS